MTPGRQSHTIFEGTEGEFLSSLLVEPLKDVVLVIPTFRVIVTLSPQVHPVLLPFLMVILIQDIAAQTIVLQIYKHYLMRHRRASHLRHHSPRA